MQWYIPISGENNEFAKYHSWESLSSFRWKHNLIYIAPSWESSDGICNYWKPKENNLSKIRAPPKQIEFALGNLHSYEEVKYSIQR